jgi:hypothetical protein
VRWGTGGLEHQHVARSGHAGQRHAVDAGKGRVGAALDALDLRDRQARRVDAVDPTGGEQVAFLQVGIGGHEAQLQPAAVRRGVAEGHAAHAGAGVLHGNGQVAVDHQRDLAREGQHLRDLAEHAVRVDHRRAGRHAVREALVDDDLAGVGVGRVVEHLGRAARRGGGLAQLEQLAQARVVLRQRVGLARALGLHHQRLAGIGLVALGGLQVFEVAPAAHHDLHRLERHPLHRVEHRAEGRADRLHDVKACIGHHEEQGERAEEDQLAECRLPLVEQGWRCAIERAQRHEFRPGGGAESNNKKPAHASRGRR